MLTSPDSRLVISHLGWVDKSALWAYDATKDAITSLSVGEAKYLTIHPCKNPAQFAVLHHYDGSTVRITVHSFDQPGISLCTIQRTGTGSSATGDLSALQNAPRYYRAYFDPGHDPDYYLLVIDVNRQEIRADHFNWFDDSYDKSYQGIVGVLELPSGNLIISVQRDSNPILYDPESRQVLRKISLAGRAGNPSLQLAALRNEIWADDYDTLLKLDADSFKVKASRRLQGSAGNAGQFIGRWSFDREESLCLVPRPFSGDALAISMETMKTISSAKLGQQPLDAALLKGGRVVARDWKTGVLLNGTLR